jgi:hypothetical protein
MLTFLVDVREGQVATILHSTIPAGPLKPQAAHTAKGGTSHRFRKANIDEGVPFHSAHLTPIWDWENGRKIAI